MIHPQTYELTRDEWLAINRALCGARLELRGVKTNSTNERLMHTDVALDIISTVYKRAEEKRKR